MVVMRILISAHPTSTGTNCGHTMTHFIVWLVLLYMHARLGRDNALVYNTV